VIGAAIVLFSVLPGQNPGWPASDPALPPEALARPENMPGDPEYPPRLDRRVGCAGQLELYSFTATCTPAIARAERGLGSGVAADRAWLLTTGDPRVTVAILDLGAPLSDPDLAGRWRLNEAEIPGAQDRDGDGVLTVRDFTSASATVAPAIDLVTDERLLARNDRGDANGNGLLDPEDLIRVFSDGTDADENGFVDDLAGWDFAGGDNDASAPIDSGFARAIAAEANNGIGGIGVCPRCTIVPFRVSSNARAPAERAAQALLLAASLEARLIAFAVRPAYGGGFLRAALDFAEKKGALAIVGPDADGGLELSSLWTSGLFIGALGHDRFDLRFATTALARPPSSSPSLRLQASAPGGPLHLAIATGVAALALSEADSIGLQPRLEPRELAQLLVATARRPSEEEAWTSDRGAGRIDARAAVEAVMRGEIPPEVEILSPSWATVFDPTSGEPILVKGALTNRRLEEVTWVLEHAIGATPAPESFAPLASGSAPAGERVEIHAALPTTSLFPDPAAPPSAPLSFSITLRLVATARSKDGPSVRSEVRRVLYVHRDLRALPAFPIDLGVPIAAAPRVVDLDGDGRDEITVATLDGAIELVDGLGRRRRGFPAGAPILTEVRGPAFASGELGFDPIRQPIAKAPAIGRLESNEWSIVAVTTRGKLIAFDLQGNLRSGFPVSLPDPILEPLGPAIADLDADGRSEIIALDRDGTIAVFEPDGTERPGFPVEVGAAVGAPALGDLDGDGRLEIVTASHERVFAFSPDGAALSGWPISLEAAPPFDPSLLPGPVVLADLRKSGSAEVLVAPLGRAPIAISGAGSVMPIGMTSREAFGGRSQVSKEGAPIFPIGGELAAVDLDQDGTVDLASIAAPIAVLDGLAPDESELRGPLLSVWSPASGAQLAGFPFPLQRGAISFAAIDLDGDHRREIIFDDGHERLEARSGDGIVPRGWPKLTGGETAGGPAIGDLIADGALDVVAATADGRVWAWRTSASLSERPAWEGARHDLAATGNVMTPTVDRSPEVSETSCGCTNGRSEAGSLFGAIAIAFWLRRRRR
jgi:hypothetical protein